MHVEVRLFATLRKHLPSGNDGTTGHVDVPAGSSIADVLDRLDIPPAMASLMLVNGRYESDRHRKLEQGCVLSVWPPVAGG